uniref:AIG1-type G domain-containing protein n=1 Tax=Cyprinus carpio TaxID=7962 RepID=A0A8C2FCB7_CYPCA
MRLRKIVTWIQNKFGKHAMNYTFILFTHADHLNGERVEDHIRRSPDLQLLINQFDGRYHSSVNILKSKVHFTFYAYA